MASSASREIPQASAIRTLRAAAAASSTVVLSLVAVAAATGFLYLLRGPSAGWPGPFVHDALPLDELPGHDAVPLVLFLLVWGAAASILAYLASLLRLERLLAALAMTLGVGATLFALDAFSLYVVRQVPAGEALRAAAHLKAIYLPAALAGAAGAVMGRPRHVQPRRGPRPRAPLVLAWVVGATGLLDVASAMTPEIGRRLKLLETFTHSAVPPLASAVVVPFGLTLLLTARGLARGKRRAWLIAVALLAGSAVLHLLKGLDFEEATISGLVALILVAGRQEFTAPGDPGARPRLVARAATFGATIYSYGLVALWVNRSLADQPYSLHFAFLETTRALAVLTVWGSRHVAGSFGGWFPLSIFLMEAAAVGHLLSIWLAPWRYRLRPEARHRERARRLVRQWGTDTLAPFTLRPDKSYFFGRDERSFIAYRVVANVAIMSGDPIGPPEAAPDLVEAFVEFAHDRDWRVAALGASEERLGLYHDLGLHSLYHGDEALIDAGTFSLEGRAIRKVRQSVHRLDRLGYRPEAIYAGEIDPRSRQATEALADEWRGDQPQRGFVMALDRLFGLDGRDELFVRGNDPQGNLRGFLHFAVAPAGAALSLSSMPRDRSAPNGFNEWLICQAVWWAAAHGFRTVSLNFAPFAGLLDPAAELSRMQRMERGTLLALKSRMHFQLDNLLMFNSQFQPVRRKRFVVYERRSDLPRVGIAALAAEGYLPLFERRAG